MSAKQRARGVLLEHAASEKQVLEENARTPQDKEKIRQWEIERINEINTIIAQIEWDDN
jgi:hypothetical protein